MAQRINKIYDHLSGDDALLNRSNCSSNDIIQRVPLIDITTIISEVRDAFNKRASRSLEWRMHQLEQMMKMLIENEDIFIEALRKDLGRPALESYASELAFLKQELTEVQKNLELWINSKSVSVPLAHFPASANIRYEPIGVVLIISAWNYPFAVALSPLLGALAAGNCVVLKLSEISQNSSNILASTIPKYLDEECVRVIEGGVAETTEILRHKFDHIIFTGNTRVGKIVYRAAAEHLTPVTLELGGKCPVIIDETANIDLAARRCLWGKVMNCGQICIAPDYVLVAKNVEQQFYDAIFKAYQNFFPDGAENSKDYGRIVNMIHTDRLLKLLDEDEHTRGSIVLGGENNRKAKFISPTVIANTKPSSLLMQEEIFGPILPCFSVYSFDEAIEFINQRPKPLAVYLFSNDISHKKKVVRETSSGAVVMNDVIVHFAVTSLPFGGIGCSGIGAYHGKHTFERLSHKKAVLHKSGHNIFDPALRYPPFTPLREWALRKFLG